MKRIIILACTTFFAGQLMAQTESKATARKAVAPEVISVTVAETKVETKSAPLATVAVNSDVLTATVSEIKAETESTHSAIATEVDAKAKAANATKPITKTVVVPAPVQ